MRAAMTGHLVISTIHTEDAVSAIDRLRDMGVEPYLIASGLRGIISQRLLRKICTQTAGRNTYRIRLRLRWQMCGIFPEESISGAKGATTASTRVTAEEPGCSRFW
jgi:type II secretory ATPase GspE/PulE/Tfp pilus assembly ATPase PilB-like protein